jgi:hypothetical protein
MKSPDASIPPANAPLNDKDDVTGLPGLHTWRSVYLFVFACFVLSVLLLLALTVIYS